MIKKMLQSDWTTPHFGVQLETSYFKWRGKHFYSFINQLIFHSELCFNLLICSRQSKSCTGKSMQVWAWLGTHESIEPKVVVLIDYFQ